ncbi:Similar to Nhlrc2: NHL repeat-containing protein 2 (Mus musculus) [Cotesia congregata]|uniref:Similar to Nhlrc2: NHL repeat-containing protein 2 (Mus musculus) n=1 Tax=Cotesia congregata TaxID=51543 RepID=A0A8J2H5S9_COTCN|nr:Similar to Nhlrc2: NHL repeat-containing protein 2 (Mus musculus) [Cotesia congregata]
MCGQENKKMSIEEIVDSLTHVCMDLRNKIKDARADQVEIEKIIIKHIKEWSSVDNNSVNDFQKGLEWFNVGVHSAKFSNEKDSAKIQSAVQRYNISHPVVNDAKLSMWRDIGISCWPSLVILGPDGQVLFVLVGEGHRRELLLYTQIALKYFKSLKKISNHGLDLKPAAHLLPVTRDLLLFPGKVQVLRDEKILVSDTGNNRVLVLDFDGQVEAVVGGYSRGFKDGSFKEARFNAPQGVCALEDDIFVADNENHAIRVINLKDKTVKTLAGIGTQGNDYVGGKTGTEQALSSPWDVAIYQHAQNNKSVPVLLIAIAGTHQIWAYFFEDTTWWKNRQYKAKTCSAIVGSGKEENRNNSYPHAAGLAQPSGLAVAQGIKALFFADSESSSVRRVHMLDGKVTGVVGADKNPMNLHNYGDVDGSGCTAKLQHPLGVTWDEASNVVWVADTYNHKIKKIEIDGKCTSFDEPSGLAVSKKHNSIIIADTNNHCLKIINKDDQTIKTIDLKLPKNVSRPADKKINFDINISKNSTLKILLIPKFSKDLKLTPEAPQKWALKYLLTSWTAEKISGALDEAILIKTSEDVGKYKFSVLLNLVVCKTDECIPKKYQVIFNVDVDDNSKSCDVEILKEIEIN